MTALKRFLDRHGLDENLAPKAAFGASAAMVAAIVALTPVKSLAGETFYPERDSPIGATGMATRLGMLEVRLPGSSPGHGEDRLGDQQYRRVHVEAYAAADEGGASL
jgi:hypothetical protein